MGARTSQGPLAHAESALERPRPALRWLAIAVAVAWPALAVNPAGPGLPIFSLASMLDPRLTAMNAMIHEWQPLDLHARMDQLFVAWLVAVAAAGALARTRPALPWLALGLVWTWLGCSANRNFPLAALGTLPLLAGWLATLPAMRRNAVLGALGLVMLLRHPGLDAGAAVGFVAMPPAAIAALEHEAPGRKLLNWYNWGGEIDLALAPRVRVFIDGRQYLFGLQGNRDYAVLEGAGPGWDALIARYGIDAAVFPPDFPIVAALRRRVGWRVAFDDGHAVVMVKQ